MLFNNMFSNTSSFRTSVVLGSLYQMMIAYEEASFFNKKLYYYDLEKTIKKVVNVGTIGYPDVHYFVQDYLKKCKFVNLENYIVSRG